MPTTGCTAACCFGGATVLLTRNTRDFPVEYLGTHGVRVLGADEFLSELLHRRPSPVVATVRRLAGEKHNPTRTPCDIAGEITRAGEKQFGSGLSRRLGCS
jgi:hypothetical protein